MRFAPILFAITLCAAPAEKADALLAKALKAFQQNQESEKHWNWVATRYWTYTSMISPDMVLPAGANWTRS